MADSYFGDCETRDDDTPPLSGTHPLLDACKNGDDKVVDILLRGDVTELVLRYGIYLAAKNGHKNVVEKFIERDFISFSSARVAVKKGYNKIFFMLLEYDRKHSSVFDIGEIFEAAINSGNLEVVSFIYKSEKNLFIIPSNMFKSVFNSANQSVLFAGLDNHLHIVKFFLRNGIGKITDLTSVASVLITNECFEAAKMIMDSDSKIKPTIGKEFRKYLEKKKEEERLRAQKKIYYWWIQICYDPNRDVGKRMMERSWKRFNELVSS